MRIETLLQNPDIQAALADVRDIDFEDLDEAAADRALVSAVVSALAGAGEELEDVVNGIEWLAIHNALKLTDHRSAARAIIKAAAPLLRAPLLARVATLEAEKEVSGAAIGHMGAHIVTVEAERDRLKAAVEEWRTAKMEHRDGDVYGAAQRLLNAEFALDTLLGETGR